MGQQSSRRLRRLRSLLGALFLALAGSLSAAPAALAQAAEHHRFDIPAGDLDKALTLLGQQADREVVFPADIARGKHSEALTGDLTVKEALDKLLAGSGLAYRLNISGPVIVEVSRSPLDRSGQSAARQATEASEGHGGGAAQIEEVMVTAQKIQQSANDVGMSITALSGNQLKDVGVTNPDQLGKAVLGFTFNTSAYGTPVYTMRGVGYYDNVMNAPPAVSVYVDEVPLPYLDMARAVGLDAQRVEVLKGPQGTLFGQNSTGGAVNYIANKPTAVYESGVSLQYTNFGEKIVDGFVSGALSDTVTARLAAKVDSGGAWQQSETRPNDQTGATRFAAARLLLDWRPLENLTFAFNLNGWIDQSDVQATQIVACITPTGCPAAVLAGLHQYPPPTSGRQADWDAWPATGAVDPMNGVSYQGFRHDNHFMQGSLRADYAVSDKITVTSITAWERERAVWLIDEDGMNIQNQTISNQQQESSFSQELRLTGHTSRLHWLVGGNIAHDADPQTGGNFTTVSSKPFTRAALSAYEDVKTYAAFAHGEYSFTDALSLVAGVRYTNVQLSNYACSAIDSGDGVLARLAGIVARAVGHVAVTIPPGGCANLAPGTFQPGYVSGKLDQNNVPFNVGLNWKVAPDSLLYASVSRGYKAGTFSPVGGIFALSLDAARQEMLRAYEVGSKLGLLNNHLRVNSALFYYDYQDKQMLGKITDPVLGLLNKTVNIPKSRIEGGEVDVAWVPNEAWRLSAGATYLNSRILDNFTNYTTSGLRKNMDGENLPLTPNWQALADIQYSYPIEGGRAAFVGAHVQYTGSTYSGLGEEALFETNAHTNLDFRFGLRSKDDRLSAMVYVDNVTDTYSWNFVSLQGSDSVTRLANRPRTFGIRVTLRN